MVRETLNKADAYLERCSSLLVNEGVLLGLLLLLGFEALAFLLEL